MPINELDYLKLLLIFQREILFLKWELHIIVVFSGVRRDRNQDHRHEIYEEFFHQMRWNCMKNYILEQCFVYYVSINLFQYVRRRKSFFFILNSSYEKSNCNVSTERTSVDQLRLTWSLCDHRNRMLKCILVKKMKRFLNVIWKRKWNMLQ
jgi:hypothetical protein